MGHLEDMLLKLEWAFKILKFGAINEAEDAQKAEVTAGRVTVTLAPAENHVTFKFVDSE